MAVDGFVAGEARALSSLRRKVRKKGFKTVTEDEGILRAVGAWTENAGGTIPDRPKMTAAAMNGTLIFTDLFKGIFSHL